MRILILLFIAFVLASCSSMPSKLSPTEVNDAQAMATTYGISLNPQAITWATQNVQGLANMPLSYRLSVYNAISIFYGRLINWKRYKPYYDHLFSDPKIAHDFPVFINPEDGLYFVILGSGEKLTDLPPYRKLKGKTVEEVFGYAGDKRTIDDNKGEGARQTVILAEKGRTPEPKGWFNVYYHEFGHMVHQTLMTPAEFERVDQLYKSAKAINKFLDDYAAHNSTEYFAVGLEACLAETKTKGNIKKYYGHTKDDLKTVDPDLFRFIEKLITNQTQ